MVQFVASCLIKGLKKKKPKTETHLVSRSKRSSDVSVSHVSSLACVFGSNRSKSFARPVDQCFKVSAEKRKGRARKTGANAKKEQG
jgi:hypothetical protein